MHTRTRTHTYAHTHTRTHAHTHTRTHTHTHTLSHSSTHNNTCVVYMRVQRQRLASSSGCTSPVAVAQTSLTRRGNHALAWTSRSQRRLRTSKTAPYTCACTAGTCPTSGGSMCSRHQRSPRTAAAAGRTLPSLALHVQAEQQQACRRALVAVTAPKRSGTTHTSPSAPRRDRTAAVLAARVHPIVIATSVAVVVAVGTSTSGRTATSSASGSWGVTATRPNRPGLREQQQQQHQTPQPPRPPRHPAEARRRSPPLLRLQAGASPLLRHSRPQPQQQREWERVAQAA